MATTTPNFGWPVPTSTDLVKDGATAIEALGDSIDASLVDLKGGTTGQVLSKNSNTDMDFTWVTDAAGDITGVTAGVGISGGGTSGTVTVTNSMATAIDAKGDLVAGTAADTFARLGVGTNGQILTADSAETTGLKWVTAGGSAFTKITSGTFTGASSFSVDSAFSATYANYKMIVVGTSGGGAGTSIQVRFRTGGTDNTTSNYSGGRNSTIWSTGGSEIDTTSNDSKMTLGRTDSSGGWWLSFDLLDPFASQATSAIGGQADLTRGGACAGRFNGTTSFDGIKVLNQAGNNIAGYYYIYGYGN